MSEDVFVEAARWQALQHRDDMDWASFTAWLEADPRHRQAFDDLDLLDDDVARHRGAVRAALAVAHSMGNGARPATRRRQVWGWSLAAMAVAVVGGMQALRRPATRVKASTVYRADAAPRVVKLGQGIVVSMASGSVLKVSGARADHLSLVGRAVFVVRHDPARSLSVLAAGYRIEDVGTRFEVVTGSGMMKVAVADGRVAVSAPTGVAHVAVTAGRSLTGMAGGSFTVAATSTRDMGSWQTGPLVYDAMPLGLVAADVERASGLPIRIEPAIAARPFSGVLLPKRGDAMAAALASAAGLRSGRDGEAIMLRDRARR